eukprot:2826799-Pyramimonas_sp.AAC.1
MQEGPKAAVSGDDLGKRYLGKQNITRGRRMWRKPIESTSRGDVLSGCVFCGGDNATYPMCPMIA